MGSRFFLDTNVLVYSLDRTAPKKGGVAEGLIEEALSDGNGMISFQVVQECLYVMLRKFKNSIEGTDARSYLRRVLMPLCSVYPDHRLYAAALDIASETGWSFYDSLIVGAASAANCDRLLTEDLQDGRKIRGVTIQNPFK
jgi:predicted nucleic acid-binding protein